MKTDRSETAAEAEEVIRMLDNRVAAMVLVDNLLMVEADNRIQVGEQGKMGDTMRCSGRGERAAVVFQETIAIRSGDRTHGDEEQRLDTGSSSYSI